MSNLLNQGEQIVNDNKNSSMQNIQFNVDRHKKDFVIALAERGRMVRVWRDEIRQEEGASEEEQSSITPSEGSGSAKEGPNQPVGPSVEPGQSSTGQIPTAPKRLLDEDWESENSNKRSRVDSNSAENTGSNESASSRKSNEGSGSARGGPSGPVGPSDGPDPSTSGPDPSAGASQRSLEEIPLWKIIFIELYLGSLPFSEALVEYLHQYIFTML